MGAAADPDLQIREGVCHPDSEIREEPGLNKKFFRTFGPQFGLKVKGEGRTPGASSLDPPLTGVRLESS